MKKDFILSEIRRTAHSNGGSPLGSRSFSAETGISRQDWFGKHWSKWGDALVEAGFEPNTKQKRYTDEFLLTHLARLVLELGRFPVNAELRMKARRDPHFPSHNTFRRFGRKGQLAARLAEFVTDDPAMSAVVVICEPIAAAEPAQEVVSSSTTEEETFGSVYLMKSGKHYKIGRTNAVGRRERELAVQLPEKLRTVHVITTDDPAGIESYWHRRFADKRGNGEWFLLTAADVRAFKRRKFM